MGSTGGMLWRARPTAATLEALRKSIRAERRSIAGREGAVERRVQAAHREAEDRVAQAAAAQAEAREEARQQAVWTQAQLEAPRAEVARAEAEGPRETELRRVRREAAQQVAQAQAAAKAAQEEARQAREALRAARAEARPAPSAAPTEPLLYLLDRGPASITRHRSRLRAWAETGSGPAIEAARAMAAALKGGEVTGSSRMAALTGLAGLLGGV